MRLHNRQTISHILFKSLEPLQAIFDMTKLRAYMFFLFQNLNKVDSFEDGKTLQERSCLQFFSTKVDSIDHGISNDGKALLPIFIFGG